MDLAAARLAQAIADLIAASVPQAIPQTTVTVSWREKLWTCPPDTRLGVTEVAEALGRSKHSIYQLTKRREIPHAKFQGAIVFRALDLRKWAASREVPVVRPDLSLSRGAA